MSQTLKRPMTADEFLEWDLLQPDCRHEPVDGVPVAMTGTMTGASGRHDSIVTNASLRFTLADIYEGLAFPPRLVT